MKLIEVERRARMIVAVQVTVDNMEAAAAWCDGSIKGVKLPPEERVIDIPGAYTDDDEEQRAAVGAYIVQVSISPAFFRVLPASRFQLIYVQAQRFEGIG